MNEARLRSCYNGLNDLKGIQGELETYEVVRAVQEYRDYWRPENVKVVLLAESHVFTTKQEHLVRLSRDRLPADYPDDGYVRFVYCLGYGEQDLVDDSVKQNPGTWQYWKLFKSCLHRVSNNEDFAPVLKGGTRNFTERLGNKLYVLETMRRRGIWLVDASIVGLYAPGGRRRFTTNEEVKVIQHSWGHYVEGVLAETSPRFIICVGKGVGKALKTRLDREYGGKFKVMSQPNARGIPPDERLKSFQKYFEICEQYAPRIDKTVKDKAYLIEGESGNWEIAVGLEVHAQVISKAKLFSAAATDFGAEPNTQVSLVDAAMPGMLPVINQHCIDQAVRTGLGLKAKINLRSVFERKNYFYADLPQGYQISQYLHPLVGEGSVALDLADGTTRQVGIERLHMEQDAGKSLHDQDPRRTFVDLNRSGVCLMEIVSKPDIRAPDEAGAFLRKLRSILRYLGTCDGNMEEGSMRCDVNVSVRQEGEAGLRTRTEVKNVNSVRFVMQAIEHEAERQVEVYESGAEVVQETRLFDAAKGATRPMRSKEFAHDYRYFPDPDLPPLVLDEKYVAEIEAGLPELPDARKQRFIDAFGLSAYDAGVLVAEKETAEYYEAAAQGGDAKATANWVITNLFGALNARGLTIGESPVSAENLGRLVGLITSGAISGRTAKEVFEEMVETGGEAPKIVAEKGLEQVSDAGAIAAAVDGVLAANSEEADKARAGDGKLIGWFVGQVMKQTGGKANPKMVNEMLREKLKG